MVFARIFAVLLVVLLAPSAGRAADQAAETFILKLADRALELVTDNGRSMAETRAKFDELLADTFDMRGIGRFLLGRYWRTAAPDVREDYLKAFTDNIVYTYTARLDQYSWQELKVDGSREDGYLTFVTSPTLDPTGAPALGGTG